MTFLNANALDATKQARIQMATHARSAFFLVRWP